MKLHLRSHFSQFCLGGIPCSISDLIQNRKKTVGVQMLLTKTGKIRKSRGAMNNEIKPKSNKISRRKSKLTETEKLICDTLLHESKSMSAPGSLVNGLLDFSHQENMSLSRRNNVSELVNEIIDNPRKRKSDKFPLENFFREEKRSSFGLNGIHSFGNNNQISKNLLRDAGEGDCVICQKMDRYMKITLNNTAHHNVLTLNVSCGSFLTFLNYVSIFLTVANQFFTIFYLSKKGF